MRRYTGACTALAALLLSPLAAAQVQLVTAGQIITADRTQPVVQAMAIDTRSGRLLAVGNREQLQARYPQAAAIDLQGATIVPGLIDAHAHLVNLGHMLSDAQIRNLGRVDVLMIPVGGYFTIDAEQAWALVEKLDPFVVLPMHYRGEGFGYDVIDTVDRFLGLAKRVRFFEGSALDLSAVTEPMTAVLRCPIKKS